ncbi:MAG: hypothetical protein II152_06315, partial [Succinivibrionaceae bacterium]|nr:hypothetical protein [Succinivibrionaceae bacterium]
MKKNRIMRVFSVLLALTLISTCAISGTFAKYITKAEGKDQARVAKWGIVLTMEGDELFKNEYETDDQNGFTGVSVKADNEDKLVAPGTKGDGFKATVTGKPEVATRYILEIPATWTDVVLPAGEYTDYTKLGEDGTYSEKFTLDKDYAPVKWNITVSKGNTSLNLVDFAKEFNEALAVQMGMNEYGFSATDAVNIVKTYKTQLESAILEVVNDAQNAQFEIADDGSIRLSLDFEAGKDMGFEFALTWGWDYSDA